MGKWEENQVVFLMDSCIIFLEFLLFFTLQEVCYDT